MDDAPRSLTQLRIRVLNSIHEIEASSWDQLSGEEPFQSHRWYAFGERVMSDCRPVYVLAYDRDVLIARACLWLVRNESLPPKLPEFLKRSISMLINRWPLLICRSPVANCSGLSLPDDERRAAILLRLTRSALTAGRQLGASIVLFDFLKGTDIESWPSGFKKTNLPSPGTVMENRWRSMEEYLAQAGKKHRQHFQRSMREAERLGIQLTCSRMVPDVDAALKLIRNVETRHGSAPNPWTRSLLENIELIGGRWLEARIGQKLVGCGLILEDNQTQMTTALGLEKDARYAYFRLVYASLEDAFERNMRWLRWGTGAYEVKERLGFQLEQDNFVILSGINRLTNLIITIAPI
ncbi:MAG TPA: GNAT family N-acetyltransferase [Anaerolineales bacterium]|nr:GNAT family N-acetyltransferase [Anaerolineales bacterium]